MSKKKPKHEKVKAVEREREQRIKSLDREIDAAEFKPKKRKRLQAELNALLQVRGDFHPSTAPKAGRRSVDLVPAIRTIDEIDALAERADALKQRLETASAGPSAPSSAAPAAVYDRRADEDEVAYQWRKQEEKKAKAEHDAARRTMVDPAPFDGFGDERPESSTPDQTPPAAVTTTPAAGGLPFEVPEDPVLTNGNGRPTIWAPNPKTGEAKLTAYTRVTTFIDCLEDKSMLDKWKQRTLLEGAYLEERSEASKLTGDGSMYAVGRSMDRRDAALADLDAREAAGDVFTALERAAAVKEHRDFTNRIVENLMDIGGAHDKADTGTRLHRLTELVDEGQPISEWATPSDRLDVEAYLKAKEAAGLQVLWTERRVVNDTLGLTGTMDRAYLWKPEGRTRRIRVVGDLKTGNVEWGAGKIGMQLAAYATSEGYVHDPAHLERERLSLSRTDALLVHLPAGEHRCTIYVVDLTLAGQGLDLATKVRAWRNRGKKVYDLSKPLVAVVAEDAAAVGSDS